MYGNGVRIGMANTVFILKPILLVLPVGLTACTVEVAGTTLPGAVARHTVSTARLATVASTLGSDWSSPSNDFLVFELSTLIVNVLSYRRKCRRSRNNKYKIYA